MICTEEAKNDFQIGSFKMIRNAVFGRIIDNVSKTIIEKSIFRKCFSNRKKKGLGLSILELCKTVIYDFWFDYMKKKKDEEAKLCYTDIGNFIVYIKTERLIYAVIAKRN